MKNERKIRLRKVSIQTLNWGEQKAIKAGVAQSRGITSIPIFCRPLEI